MEEYRCLYCGAVISKDNVLFAYDYFSGNYKDTIRFDFLMQHSLKLYPLKNGNRFNTLYYRPIDNEVIARDSNGFPNQLKVRLCRGLTPAELLMKEPKATPSKSEMPLDSGLAESGASDLSDTFDPKQTDDGPADSEKPDSDEVIELAVRACPKCHCRIPHDFGLIPTITVTLFGGRASGKTAFLIAMFQQLNSQLGRNVLGSNELLPESETYLRPLIDAYVTNHGITDPTHTQRLFPLVSQYRSFEGKSCFIVMHDIAGEGVKDDNYLLNHDGIKKASIMMLIIDPNQINPYHRAQLATQSIFTAGADSPAVETAEQHEYFDEQVISYLQARISRCKRLAPNVRHVITILTKMDMPLSHDKDFFGTSQNVLLKKNIDNQHHEAVDLDILRRIDKELDNYYRHNLREADIKALIHNLFGNGIKDVSLMAVSTHTLKPVANCEPEFESDSSDMSAKHRIIEPFLKVLVLNDMVRTKGGQLTEEHAGTRKQTKASSVRSKRHGFLSWLGL